MIVITVQTYNGQAMSGLAAHFDELGGTIGRAENNQLVLADPDRTVSRVHAQVVFRNGGFAIIDRGSNAILVNGQPLGNGREAPIRDGDLLSIGGYVLRVDVGQKAAAADPNSPLAKVGYSGFSLLFDDEGLMARLEPQLAQARAGMLGVNADGTPKTELTDADLMTQATAMAGTGGVTPEKLLPLVKAIYGFVMKPDVIAVAVRIDPALTISEFRSLTPQPGATAAPAAPAVDWNSRLTIDAHN